MTNLFSKNTKPNQDNFKRENDWILLKRLLPAARRHGRLLLLALLLLIPLSLSGAIQPILIGQAISLLRQEPTWSFLANKTLTQGLITLDVLLLLTIAIRLALESSQNFLVQKVGQRITADIRNDLFNHVTSLAVRFFDRTPVGKLITRLTSDVEALGEVFSTGAIGIISDIFSILVICVIMFTLQWQLATMLILMLLPVTAVIIYFQQQYREANYKAREELSSLNAMLQENISGIGVVQIFRREKINAELFRANNQKYVKEVDHTIFYDAAVSATLEWIALVAIAGVLWLGGWQIMQKELNFGILASFILFAQRLFDPLRQFAEKFTAIQAGLTAIERVNEILSQPIEIQDKIQLDITNNPENKILSNQKSGEIRFDHVWFAYKDNEYVIKDLNFVINPGEKIALVGPTGAGKSSIIRLLCRLYEPSRGRILLDGVDIRDMPQAELRRHLGVILQDGFIFAGDVKSNISLGDDYTIEEIRSAAIKTNIDNFIEDLPQSYDTQLRERGTNLSSGQKQLLAFARAAIRNPGLLVLDEATASLDVGTEALIQDALDKLLEGRSAIIIAHRLSTIRNVDKIFVLQRGQLVETGSHEELLQQGGLYASLYNLQMLGN